MRLQIFEVKIIIKIAVIELNLFRYQGKLTTFKNRKR